MCQLQGSKEAKLEWFNPYPALLKQYEKSEFGIPSHVSQTFLELSAAGKIPSWAIGKLKFG